MSPRVCLCVPCYNSSRTILKTLQSLVEQEYDNYHILVFDNCSTDNTVELIQNFISGHIRTDIRLYINKKNIGGAGNFNKCIYEADGDYFAICHADDEYKYNFVKEQINFLDNHPDVAISFTDAEMIDDEGIVWGYSLRPEEYRGRIAKGFDDAFHIAITYGDIWFCPSAMFRKLLFVEQKEYFESKYANAADYGFFFDSTVNYGTGFVPKILIRYRAFSNSSFSFRTMLQYRKYMQAAALQVLHDKIVQNHHDGLLNSVEYRSVENAILRGRIKLAWLHGDYDYVKKLLSRVPVDKNNGVSLKSRLFFSIFVNFPMFAFVRRLIVYYMLKKIYANVRFSDIDLEKEEESPSEELVK